MFQPFLLSSDWLHQVRVSSRSTLTFPSSCSTYSTGCSLTDSVPLGMDNPRLKPPDSVINDMSAGCDPCSLAAMPLVEPRELGELTRETCTIMHCSKAALWQTYTEADRTFISNTTCIVRTLYQETKPECSQSHSHTQDVTHAPITFKSCI